MEPTTNEPAQLLWAAMAQARAAMTPLVKDSENNFHNYRYTSADTMIGSGSRCLAAHGLSLIVQDAALDTESSPNILVATLLLAHSGGGTVRMSHHMAVLPDKGRPHDKALCSARTVLLAYCYRDVLGIERPDSDDDIAGRDDTAYATPKRTSQPINRQPISNGKPKTKNGKTPGQTLKEVLIATDQAATAAEASVMVNVWAKQFKGRPPAAAVNKAIASVRNGNLLLDDSPSIDSGDIDEAMGKPNAVSNADKVVPMTYGRVVDEFVKLHEVDRADAISHLERHADNVGLKFEEGMPSQKLNFMYMQTGNGSFATA